MKQVVVAIDDETHKGLSIVKARTGKKIKELLAEAIKEKFSSVQ